MMQIEQQYLNLNSVRMNQPPPETTVPPPPVVICPTEVDSVNITLEKNQQCACKDCGKLFNSVWYLKQHAVKHSNDRPFRCKFCYKTYKFRSNLYQHKCPDRIKNGNTQFGKRLMCRFTVNQPQLFDTTKPSAAVQQQAPQRTVAPEIGHYFNNGPNFDLPPKPAVQNSERIRAPIETIAPETLTEKHQIELHEGVTPKRFLEQGVIDNYLQKYKHKLYQCRKCKLQFPTRGYLSRHTAQHAELDQVNQQCDQCPQRFSTDVDLKKHIELHSKDSGILCTKCCASFRSMLALRRHRNQSRQCELPSAASSFSNQSLDEYAYIDAVDAVAQMSSTTTNGANNGGQEQFASPSDEVGGCSTANSSTDCYQSYTPDPIRPSDVVNENGSIAYENGSKRTITTVKIKLGSTPVVSILKKKDDIVNDEQPLHKNRISYPELDDLEATNSEAMLDGESRRRLSLSGAFDISTNGHINYGSYFHSNRSTTSTNHHAGMSTSSSGGVSDNGTQTNGGGGGGVEGSVDGAGGGGGGGGGESHFVSSSAFESFPANSSSDVYDGLVLEDTGRPLILHTHTRATKARIAEAVSSQPAVADLISCTAQSIRDEIRLNETLCTVRTQFLRTVAVQIIYTTVLQIVEYLVSFCGEHKTLNRSTAGAAAATAAVPHASTANSLEVIQSEGEYRETTAEKKSSNISQNTDNTTDIGRSDYDEQQP